MISIEICRDFEKPENWHALDTGSANKAPNTGGIYVIRIARGHTFGRLKGESDIVYIGSGNVRQRLRAHLTRDDFKDKAWLLAVIHQHKDLQFAWLIDKLPDEKESRLLGGYLLDHLELPPANRRIEKLSDEHKAVLRLKGLAADKRESVLRALSPGGKPFNSQNEEA